MASSGDQIDFSRAEATGPRRPAVVTVASILLLVAFGLVLTINVFIAIMFVVLAVLVFRGQSLARLVTLGVVGFSVLCLGGGQITRALASVVGGPRSESAVPKWVWDRGTAIDIITLAVLIVVGVLLALPSAGAFFRRPTEDWTPPPPTP